MLVAPQHPLDAQALVAATAVGYLAAVWERRLVAQLASAEREGPGAVGDAVVQRDALALPGRIEHRAVQRQAQVIIEAQWAVQAEAEVQAMAPGQVAAAVVEAAVQVPARGHLARLHDNPGAALQFAGQQFCGQVISAQAVELVEALLQGWQVQWLPEQAGKGAGEGQGQFGAGHFDGLDEPFDDDQVQRCAVLWRLLQVRPAGRVSGLHIALGDGFQQPVDFRDAHARGNEPAKGWR
ncbi:hypothetical protein D3C81_1168840 [compost metagenome]